MLTPSADCALCPRLAAFRAANRAANPAWFNAPVPSFGPELPRLLIVGLAPGLKGAIYGVIIVLFVLFEPLGLYGRWVKLKLFFQLFPLYKKATFKRQKTYMRSERNR